MSRGLGSKGPDEREVREQLRARKDELRKLADDDDIIKYDKHHAANLLSRPSPAVLADRDGDVVVTAVVHAQPPPPQALHLPPITHNPTPDERTQATHCQRHIRTKRSRAQGHREQAHRVSITG